jgi:hypothetical protein
VLPRPVKGKRRRWPWIVLVVLLVVGGCGGLFARFFVGGVLQARSVAQAQLAAVSQITAAWDVDALYQAAVPELQQETPDSVVRAYFADWRNRLGPSQSLSVAGYYFASHTGLSTIVTATYTGQFQHGTAQVVVRFVESGGRWLILGLNVVNIVSTVPPTTSPDGAP